MNIQKTILTGLKTTILASTMLMAIPATADSHTNPAIEAAIMSASRSDTDKARDASRHPEKVLSYIGVKSGDTVIDLFSGKGYYADLFSSIVGNHGKVYTVRSRAEADHIASMTNMTASGETLMTDIEAKADVVFTALNYHDLVNSDTLDRSAWLKAVADHMKPGGSFVIIDHNAASGSGATATKTLHRIEMQFVIDELLGHGFTLDSQSELLRSTTDDHTKKVFDASIRGKTDRFLLSFKKK